VIADNPALLPVCSSEENPAGEFTPYQMEESRQKLSAPPGGSIKDETKTTIGRSFLTLLNTPNNQGIILWSELISALVEKKSKLQYDSNNDMVITRQC
jgi:hypothetical protein